MDTPSEKDIALLESLTEGMDEETKERYLGSTSFLYDWINGGGTMITKPFEGELGPACV